MMKTFLLIIALLMSPLFAEEEETRQGILVENDGDVLNKITERFPRVQRFIDDCDEASFRQNGESKEDCIWREVTNANLNEQVIDALNDYREPAANQDDEDAPKYNYNLDNFKQTKTKPIKKLEEYLKKRFEEALYGKDNTQGVKAVQDHTNFYRLWQSQLGKNLITELSRYCIFSDPVNGKVPYRLDSGSSSSTGEREAATFNRKKNIERLGQVQNGESAAYSGFEACIGQIAGECNSSLNAPPPAQGTPAAGQNQQPQSNSPTFSYREHKRISGSSEEPYSGKITHPCEINRYMTGVKKSLKAIEGLVDELGNQQPSEAFAVNLRQREAMNINQITNVSSGEIMEADGFKDAVAEEAEILQRCADSQGQEAGCEEYMSDAAENKKIEDEALIRGLALKAKIKNELIDGTDDEEVLMQFFLEKGMSQENFNTMVDQRFAARTDPNQTRIDIIKKIIEETYDSERSAIHKSLQDRLNETAFTPEDTANNVAESRPDFAAIKQRVETSPEELAVVYHYANVVSSFITVTGGSEPGKNTAALAAELANPAFSDSGGSNNRGVASGTGFTSDLSQLEGMGDPSDASSGSEAQVQLGSGEIDQIQFGIREPSGDDTQ